MHEFISTLHDIARDMEWFHWVWFGATVGLFLLGMWSDIQDGADNGGAAFGCIIGVLLPIFIPWVLIVIFGEVILILAYWIFYIPYCLLEKLYGLFRRKRNDGRCDGPG